jgi:exonuclease SbcC
VKILAISLKNLASFAGEVTIDFRTPPLAHAGVFAILGRTGAGKSTILDALCLALYGTTPRANAGNDAKVPGDGDTAWSTGDPRHLIRRGADEAYAKVVFEAESKLYEATWRCVRARRGALQLKDDELELRHGCEVIATKIRSVQAKVAELTGLDFDSFCRSVLLPQGKFESFLSCDSKQRSVLLEALTDPKGLYRGVSRLAHERGGQASAEVAKAEEAVRAIEVLTDEARAGRETKRDAQEAEAKRVADAHEAARSARQQYAALDEAARRRDERRAELTRCEVAQTNAAPDRKVYEEARAAQPLRATGKRLDETAKRLRDADAQLVALDADRAKAREAAQRADEEKTVAASMHDDALAVRDALGPQLAEARRLDDALATARAALAKSNEEREEREEESKAIADREAEHDRVDTSILDERAALATWHVAHPEAATLSAQRGWWSPAVASAQKARSELAAAHTAQEDATRKVARLDDDYATAEAARADAEQRESAAQRAVEDATERAETHCAAEVREQRDRARERTQDLNALRTALDQRRADRQRADELRSTAAHAAHERAVAEAARAACQADIERLEIDVKRAEREHALAQARASLDKHRQRLVAGEPCVVCGSTMHPWADPSAVPVADDDTRAALQASLATARESLRAHERAIIESEARARSDKAEADRLFALLDTGRPALAERCVRLALASDLDADALARAVDALGESLARDQTELDAAVQKAEDAIHAVNAARTHRESCRDALQQAGSRCTELQMARERVRGEVSNHAALRANAEAQLCEADERLATALAAIPDAVAAWRVDPGTQAEAWARLAEEHDDRRRTHDDLDHRTRALDTQRTETVFARRRHAERCADLDAKRANLTQQITNFATERAAVLDGRSADDVAREADARCRDARAALDATGVIASEAARRATELEARREERASQRTLLADDASDAARAHSEQLTVLGLDEGEATRRLALDAAALDALRDTIAKLDDTVTKAALFLEEADNILKTAKLERPSASREELDAEIEKYRSEQERLQQDLGAHRQALAYDDVRRAHREEKQREVEAIRSRVGVWSTLADVVASHDGSKLALYAQSLAFDSLLAAANAQLASLHPRYALRRLEEAPSDAGGKKAKTSTLLDMVVVDRELADAIRPVTTLSGGERFLVSLALALGLSSLASRRRKLASMFIDEGFGTLDPETLSVALGVLDALQASGTRVGIISHVSELKERLQARVVVQRRGDGTSTVRIEA